MSQNLRNIDLNLLTILHVLMEECHVSKSAQKLNMTQSAVSHALNRLRHHFDDPLFIREGKNMIPTDFADTLYSDLKNIINQIDNITTKKDAFHPQTDTTNFIIGMPEYCAVAHIAAIHHAIKEAAPHITITTLNTNMPNSIDAIQNGDVDFIVGYVPTPPKSIQSITLYTERYIGSKSTRHKFKTKTMSLEEYSSSKHLHISLNAKNTGLVDNALTKIKAPRKHIELTLSNYMLGGMMLQNSDMIMTEFSKTSQALSHIFDIETFELPFKSPTFNVSLNWHSRKSNNAAHTFIRNILIAACKAP